MRSVWGVLLLCAVAQARPQLRGSVTEPTNASGFPGPIFELDLFMNDPKSGWQASGFPDYLQHSAANYTNVAGISFVQPSDLMDGSYDLPPQVANAVSILRKQGVAVQLLIGGEISSGWADLQSNPQEAATNAIKLMSKHDCGIEIDNEAGGDSTGLITFITLCAKGKPAGTYMSMDVGGTPKGAQKAVIQGAIEHLDWVNLMVSAPSYDQGNSVKYGHADGIPFDKITVAYYAGTWVDNCNSVGSGAGSLGAGLKLFKEESLKGLSIWAVGGASYSNCKTTDAPGFSATLAQLKAAPAPAPPAPPTPPGPPTPPTPPGSCAAVWGPCGTAGHPVCCQGSCSCAGSAAYKQCTPAQGKWQC